MSETADREPRIVVVGAGPSGCFVAGALRRALPAAQLLVVDRLPCPFGLVRYGVAADHQSTKNITRQFDRIFTKERVDFAGNVRVTASPEPGAVSLDELAERADAIVLATGLAADRPLGIPGDTLDGVFGSGAITRALNTHPDADTAGMLDGLGDHVAIVGMGNVAIDLVRFLAKTPADFAGSDVNDAALAAYQAAPATKITVLSRSAITHAKCDAQMVRELGQIAGLRVEIEGAGSVDAEALDDRVQRSRVEALRALAEQAQDPRPRVTLRLVFGATPVRVLGEERVAGLRVQRAGAPATEPTTTDIAATSVLSAIGFAADEHSPLADASDVGGRVRPGLYRVGWCRRGPNGTIPDNRADAVAVAAEVVADLERGQLGRGPLDPAMPLLPAAIAADAVSYSDWLQIDQHECATAAESRSRTKLPTRAQMLDVARAGTSGA